MSLPAALYWQLLIEVKLLCVRDERLFVLIRQWGVHPFGTPVLVLQRSAVRLIAVIKRSDNLHRRSAPAQQYFVVRRLRGLDCSNPVPIRANLDCEHVTCYGVPRFVLVVRAIRAAPGIVTFLRMFQACDQFLDACELCSGLLPRTLGVVIDTL